MLLRPFGSLSIRSFLLFVTTLVVTVFAFIFASAPAAHAAPAASWDGAAITYNGNKYERFDDIPAGSSTGLAAGTKVYSYRAPADFGVDGAPVHFIYFPPGSDPTKLTSATYITYKVTGSTYSDPSGKTTITLTAQTDAQAEESTTSCVVEGIGWVVCPVTNFLSKAMDWLFDAMSAFLEVRPTPTDQESALYRGWAIMRNIANLAFVAAFMVIIYSQITNIGLSSYGIKRLLPRVIAAAILVNVSYWICAIAVDLSNIFGYALYDMLTGMRNDLVGAEGNNFDVLNFESLAGFILSGGTAAAATGIGLYMFAAGAGGAIFMLLPVLVGVIISALVALLIMAARQAIIVVMIIVAPLAFVAYLLPNTEKFFDKWKDLFSTMLLLFPMFAIVLGGAQLAGEAIIQNADSINLIILGMAVKVAPVVITPFLLKFSGSLLGKIAGVVNNPGKGLMDRTRNFAQEKNDAWKSRQMAQRNPNWLAERAQNIDARKRKRDGWKKANDSRRDATWANSKAYSDIHSYDADTGQIKSIGENRANQHYADLQRNNAATQGLDIRARASKVDLDLSQAKVEANWAAVQAGVPTGLIAYAQGSQSMRDIMNHSQDASRDLALVAMRKQAAERVQTLERGTQLMNNTAMIDGQTLQAFAGGIDPNGSQRALAEALTKQHSARGEAVKNAQAVIEHKNLTDASVGRLALGDAGNTGIAVTDDVIEAAIKMVAGGKNAREIYNLLEAIDVSPTSNDNHRVALTEALGANGLKPKYITGSALGRIKQGQQPLGERGIDELIQAAVKEQKLSPASLADQDPAYLKRIFEAIGRDRAAFDAQGLVKLRDNILFAKDPANQLAGRLGDNEPVLDDILAQL